MELLQLLLNTKVVSLVLKVVNHVFMIVLFKTSRSNVNLAMIITIFQLMVSVCAAKVIAKAVIIPLVFLN